MKAKLITTIVLLFLVILFVIQNAATVEIRFFVWEASIPRSLLILLTLVAGIVVGWFLRAMYRISRTAQ